jgi:hypothetical protein
MIGAQITLSKAVGDLKYASSVVSKQDFQVIFRACI